MANAGMVGLDWQQRINWDRLRKYRLERARERMKAHGLGAMLLMYDEYDPPVISRIWSLDHPVEIKEGMVFALETQHGKKFEWGVRIEEMLIVHKDRIEIISSFPVERITVVDPLPGYSTLSGR